MNNPEERYLELLLQLYPTPDDAKSQAAALSAELGMPKETEFFISDIHGEYAAFSHILRNASGEIRRRIHDLFADELSDETETELSTLIYYPAERIALLQSEGANVEAYCNDMLPYVLALAADLAASHTPQCVEEAFDGPYAELALALLSNATAGAKSCYGTCLRQAVSEENLACALVEDIAHAIQNLAVDHLHMVGDVFDRGPYPELIMEELMGYHSLDIAWGNHDIVWMGAALGQWGCIAHVVRNCARYGNLSILEDSYGINLRPLAAFAMSAYADDPCIGYALKGDPGLSSSEHQVNVKIQKAMAILQFKVEAALIDENPSFELQDRKLLHKVDLQSNTVEVDGVHYEITDPVFPTVDWNDPYRLTPEEQQVMESLELAFTGCEKLQRHVDFLLQAGSLYKIYNGNLIFHACVPLNADGTLKEVNVFGETYKGRALYDACDHYVRQAFLSEDAAERKRGADFIWYLWLGVGSPLFAKSKMATFEIYMCKDKAARKEVKNPFYSLFDDAAVFDRIFKDFGLNPETAHIICGHVPVKVKDGEDPVKCKGRVFCIDGGFSSAYQGTTGIAGFTLVFDAHGYFLDAHTPIPSQEQAVADNLDIVSDRREVERFASPLLVADVDLGRELRDEIHALEVLAH